MPAKVPEVVASVSLTNQSATIGTTTLYSPSTAGLFRINQYGSVKTNGDGFGFHVNWTDTAGNAIAMTSFGIVSAPNGNISGSASTMIIQADASTNITYSVPAISLTGADTYNLYIVVESLQ